MTDQRTMSTAELRTEIVEMIKSESDTSVLEAIRTLLYKLRIQDDAEDELTDEEIAELERRRARYLSGESKPHSVEESMRLAREGFKK